jgi:hypothetical protein
MKILGQKSSNSQTVSLNGLCQEMNIFFKAGNNKKIINLLALVVLFPIFCFLVDEKLNLKF